MGASDKAGCVLRCWQIVLIIVGIIFLVLGIMGFVGIKWSRSGVTLALLIIGALVFILCGILAFIVSAKGRQSRPLVICFMITMICFFIVALIQLILGGLAISDCGDQNLPLHSTVCGENGQRGSGWQYFFALTVILLFTSIIGAAAAFNFWRMLRQEDEGGDKYVYLAEAAY